MRVAVFGGSFNPPHVGHVLAACYLLSIGACERVLVVPVKAHAFNKALAPLPDRLALCEAAMGSLTNVFVSDREATLPPPNYTLTLLEALAAEHPSWQLRLVIGTDVLAERHLWHAFDEVERLAPLIVLGRAGYSSDGRSSDESSSVVSDELTRFEAPPAFLPEVSSTEVRALLARRGEPGVREALALRVPARVLAEIEARGLYSG
ncbi:MAG: nicotinate-nicotinamide nucleotide adenylyltransferase [Polyangiaceae bacterium]|nr:nicotinate-nicotinamide nucleotide adenylyltransferase [Polyangiaceae bacterium]MCW5792641.1 nicotinate-nicotinamide nucleotide adenylyltransferase [Polyangiaceae bacterium]